MTVGQASSATVIAPSSVSLGQTVALTATVTSPAGTVNDGQVTFHFDVTVTVGSTSIPETVQQTEPVRNGIAVFPYSPTGVNPEATTMVASFSGSTNFHNSNGSASLSIMPYAADLALTGLTISPTLQPQTATDDYHFTIGAQVTNLGPSPANDGLVSIWATDATGATFGAQYVELRNSFPANVTSLQANGSVTVPVQIAATDIPLNATFHASVDVWPSAVVPEYDPNPSNNIMTGPTLNRVFFTTPSNSQQPYVVDTNGYGFRNHQSTSDLWDRNWLPGLSY